MISWSLHLPSGKGRGASISEGHVLLLSQVMHALGTKARFNMNWPMGKLASIYRWAHTHTHRRHTPPKISGGKSSSIPGNGFMDAEFSSEESEGQDKIETSKLAVKDVLATSIWKTCVFIYAVCNQEFKKGYIYCVTKHESPWEPNAAERSLPYFYLRLWMRAGISLCGWEMETQTWCGRNETSKRMQKREELLIPN